MRPITLPPRRITARAAPPLGCNCPDESDVNRLAYGHCRGAREVVDGYARIGGGKHAGIRLRKIEAAVAGAAHAQPGCKRVHDIQVERIRRLCTFNPSP